MTNNSSIQEVLFFPQMKPEKQAVALNEEEKIVLNCIKKSNSKELPSIKEEAQLSNKKWDASIKGLTQKKLVKVVKNENGLYIEMLN
jgi:lysyl-tRNA synthetase class 2